MKSSTTVNKLANGLSWIALLIMALLPFHAFLTVWLSSLVGHYTLLRLWKELLLVPIVAGALYITIKDSKFRKKLFSSWMVRLAGLYIILLSVWAFVPLATHGVTAKAMWYGLLVDLRPIVFFLSLLILATKSHLLYKNWPKIILAPAVIVSAFGVLQYIVLPYDFLKHFGYGPSTIEPYETINHSIQHLRVVSTLRGANPLGAYLILPISALAVLLIKQKAKRIGGYFLGAGLLLALTFSFSRSAWIGVAISALVIAWYLLKTAKARKILLWSLAVAAFIAGSLTIALHNNPNFQNTFLHTEHNSKIAESSNFGHKTAFKRAAEDIFHHPWGHGVGGAGPQSFYNDDHGYRIAENYFLQIAQEAGVIGMLLFITICIVLGQLLWQRRSDPLVLWLFASLVGITFVNLLSHAWTDDTLAYIWWGFAGVALASKFSKKA